MLLIEERNGGSESALANGLEQCNNTQGGLLVGGGLNVNVPRSPIELRERKEKRGEEFEGDIERWAKRGHCSEDGLAGGWWGVEGGG